MGYCMDQMYSEFHIKAENRAPALAACLALAREGGDFHWVSANDFIKAKSLEEVLDVWSWSPDKDENNNIVGLCFEGEKSGADFTLFETIAPFVEKGSYIEMQGEDGARWRWVFNGKTCKEVYAKLDWGNDDE